MFMHQKINEYWSHVEKKHKPPTYIDKVKILDFNKLKQEADSRNEKYLKKLINGMYLKKEAYILRNAATKELKETVLPINLKILSLI